MCPKKEKYVIGLSNELKIAFDRLLATEFNSASVASCGLSAPLQAIARKVDASHRRRWGNETTIGFRYIGGVLSYPHHPVLPPLALPQSALLFLRFCFISEGSWADRRQKNGTVRRADWVAFGWLGRAQVATGTARHCHPSILSGRFFATSRSLQWGAHETDRNINGNYVWDRQVFTLSLAYNCTHHTLISAPIVTCALTV